MKISLLGYDIELTIQPSQFNPTVKEVWALAMDELKPEQWRHELADTEFIVKVRPNKIDLIRAARQLSIDQGFPVMLLKEAKEWVEAQEWPK